jgi:3-methyladenine DNA glycosylase AlkC
MAEPLKNIYNKTFFANFLSNLPEVPPSVFFQKIFDNDWEKRELKQRMRHIALTLGETLPNHYPTAIAILKDFVTRARASQRSEMNFEYMFLPDFIEVFGLEDYETSIAAMEDITQFTSCEFAVRPFLLRYFDKMSERMLAWSKHPQPMVRRLASEGMRPLLPWAMGVPQLKKDPSPVLSILENLKSDPSETVRRSVANNLNDIAKNQPDIVLALSEKWRGISPEVDWVIRHGSRTLLKRANVGALQAFGFGSAAHFIVENLILDKMILSIGEGFIFRFSVKNTSNNNNIDQNNNKARIEYGIDYVKATGKTSRKIFQISETTCQTGQILNFERKHSFKDLTTRTHYKGQHQLAIIINGVEKAVVQFDLV